MHACLEKYRCDLKGSQLLIFVHVGHLCMCVCVQVHVELESIFVFGYYRKWEILKVWIFFLSSHSRIEKTCLSMHEKSNKI